MRPIALALTIAAALGGGIALPAAAQQADRVLIIYGNDKCPTNASGAEIMVCSKRPEAERYRIPKELRSPIVITPQNESWAKRANSTLDAGANTGNGSCSAIGALGATGCFEQRMRAAKAQRRADAAERSATP